MPENKVLLSSEAAEKPIFGLLSGLLSLSFAMLMLSAAWIVFPSANGQAVMFNLVVVFFLILDSIFDLYIRIRSAQKLILFRKLRVVVILTPLSYAALSPFTDRPFPEMFFPDALNISGTIALLFQSMVVYNIRGILFSRSLLYTILSNQKPGQSLMELFSVYSRMVFETYDQARALRRTSLLLIVMATVMTITNGYSSGIPFFISLWYFLAVTSAFGLLSISSSYLDEHRFFAHGIVAPPKFQRIRQAWAYLILIVCIAISLFISADWAPSDPSALAAFIVWILSLFSTPSLERDTEIEAVMNRIVEYNQANNRPLFQFTETEPNPFWPILLEILKYVFIVGVIGILVYFLIKPLLAKDFNLKDSLKLFLGQLLNFFTEPFKRIARAIISIFKERRKKILMLTPVKKVVSPQDYIKALLRSHRDDQDRNLSRSSESLDLYAEFLEWAYKEQVRWSISDTPYDIAREIIAMLNMRFGAIKQDHNSGSQGNGQKAILQWNEPQIRNRLFTISDILEKDLFSQSKINRQELDDMKQFVHEVISLVIPPPIVQAIPK